MTSFAAATTIYAGTSSSTPARDFIVRAGNSSADARDFIVIWKLVIKGQTSIIEVRSTNVDAVYLRTLSTESSLINVRSASIGLYYNPIEGSVIYVNSSVARLAQQYRWRLRESQIEIRSGDAVFQNPFLVALRGQIRVLSRTADFQFLINGFLPAIPPSTRSFQPPSYHVVKTATYSGRTVRQIFCSRPSDGTLNLEYVNISNIIAEEVLAAYDRSYGTRYGFRLPPEIFQGAETVLVGYMDLSNSNLKWFYAAKPTVQAVSTGVCNLSVQLKARTQRS